MVHSLQTPRSCHASRLRPLVATLHKCCRQHLVFHQFMRLLLRTVAGKVAKFRFKAQERNENKLNKKEVAIRAERSRNETMW